jgi:hypothetical protein
MQSPAYGEKGVSVQWTSRDLLWRPARCLVRFVAQGLLQCLAAANPKIVWGHFSSWLRTKRSPDCPSEFVVATALRHHLPDFLKVGPGDPNWRKFLRSRLDLDQMQGARLAA